MPDVGADQIDARDDLNRRTADGFVVWGPLPAVDPLRRYRAEAHGTLVDRDALPPAKDAAEKRRRNRAAAKRGLSGLLAAIRKAA